MSRTEPRTGCHEGMQPLGGGPGIHDAMSDVVDQSVERIHLVESQRRAGAGFEVHATVIARLDAHEYACGNDEERDAADGIHGGDLPEDLGDALCRVSGSRHGDPEVTQEVQHLLGRGCDDRLGLGVVRRCQRAEVTLCHLGHPRPQMVPRAPQSLGRGPGPVRRRWHALKPCQRASR